MGRPEGGETESEEGKEGEEETTEQSLEKEKDREREISGAEERKKEARAQKRRDVWECDENDSGIAAKYDEWTVFLVHYVLN